MIDVYDVIYSLLIEIGFGANLFGELFIEIIVLCMMTFVLLVPFILIYFMIKKIMGG